MVLTESDFLATGAATEETERIIDIPRTVESVRVVALITQPPPDPSTPTNTRPQAVRVSFRSKAGTGTGAGAGGIDVAALASRWGGGGHVRAAGAKLQAPLDHVIREVTQALEAAVESQP
jgi:phosphoesterase RecJ-like protein